MLAKVLTFLLAILVALWAAGVDLRDVKGAATGVASDNARSMTGHDGDWG